MTLLKGIQDKFLADQFEFSQHAVDRMILRFITVRDVREAVGKGEVIEDYPDDKYGSSCLILGFTTSNRPLHIQASYPIRPLIKVITVYEPDPDEWIDYKVRVN